MTDQGFFHRLDASAILTIVGIIILFSGAIGVTLVAPSFVDPSWTQPTSYFQVQMYEVADPHFYVARSAEQQEGLEFVHHLIEDYTLMAFRENETTRFIAPEALAKYVTKAGDKTLKLTSKLLLLRQPMDADKAKQLQQELQTDWEKAHAHEATTTKPDYQILELYDPELQEAFAVAFGDGVQEHFTDNNFTILDDKASQPYHSDPGVVYVLNPQEYRVRRYVYAGERRRKYDPNGVPVKDLTELTGGDLGFRSRQQLIAEGEHIYAIEGCWYCHTDQSRTLIQDCVLNGSESYAAPPSAANEYIYQQTTFPGTRRIGPDLARVAIKRPSRDWHKSHFWAPKTASKGSIMPAFRHFFDDDPRGQHLHEYGIPNYQFEAMFQYLMTKGTRITPPTKAWWKGKDPVKTTAIIEGIRTLPP